jgi:hypothetical protein
MSRKWEPSRRLETTDFFLVARPLEAKGKHRRLQFFPNSPCHANWGSTIGSVREGRLSPDVEVLTRCMHPSLSLSQTGESVEGEEVQASRKLKFMLKLYAALAGERRLSSDVQLLTKISAPLAVSGANQIYALLPVAGAARHHNSPHATPRPIIVILNYDFPTTTLRRPSV